MTGARHLGPNRLLNPPRGSRYAFLVEAYRLAIENLPPLWATAAGSATGMLKGPAALCGRWHDYLTEMDVERRGRALELLKAGGFPADQLSEPLAPGVDSLVKWLMLAERAALWTSDRHKSGTSLRTPRGGARSISLEKTLIIGLTCRALSHERRSTRSVTIEAARILNDGAPIGRGLRGLNGDQVRREWLVFRRIVLQLYQTLGVEAAMCVLRTFDEAIRDLNALRDMARQRSDFSRLDGAELARAIHSRHDLALCFNRLRKGTTDAHFCAA